MSTHVSRLPSHIKSLFGVHAQVSDALREAPVDNEGLSNIHTKTQLSTGASREAPVDNDLF